VEWFEAHACFVSSFTVSPNKTAWFTPFIS